MTIIYFLLVIIILLGIGIFQVINGIANSLYKIKEKLNEVFPDKDNDDEF